MNKSMPQGDSKAYWNNRAATFGQGCGKRANPYARAFIERLAALPSESILDMGCATGTLAVPLADAGHKVIACDLAENMIEALDGRLVKEGLCEAVTTHVLAWEDDWDAAGIGSNSVDVAVASRCISGPNMESRIKKLDRTACRRCAITVSASLPPMMDPLLLRCLEREAPTPREDIVALGILADMGRAAELSFIHCERPMRFGSWDEALFELENLAGSAPLNQRERRLFDEYARTHFKESQTEDGSLVVSLDYKIMVRWAFISWNVDEWR